MFCFMLGFVITVVVFSLSYELVCYKSELNYNNFDLVALPAPTDGTNSTSNTLKVKRRICKWNLKARDPTMCQTSTKNVFLYLSLTLFFFLGPAILVIYNTLF